MTAGLGLGVPEYVVTETGPDHEKTFAAEVVVAGEVLGTGSGRSKKEAEQEAASAAWTVVAGASGRAEHRPLAAALD